MTDRVWTIYVLSDPRGGGVRYVGVTLRSCKMHLREHVSKAMKGGRTHRDAWIRSLASDDVAPAIAPVESGFGSTWQGAERRWIAHHLATGARLVNHTTGGEGTPGYVPTPELRVRWSSVRKGKPYSDGRIKPMLGQRHTAEARQKIRLAGMGRRLSETARAKLSLARKGKRLAPEHIEKMAAAKRGRTLTPEHKAKIAASTRGRVAVMRLDTGEVFASVTAAARHLGVNEASINQACRKGGRCRGAHWRRVG